MEELELEVRRRSHAERCILHGIGSGGFIKLCSSVELECETILAGGYHHYQCRCPELQERLSVLVWSRTKPLWSLETERAQELEVMFRWVLKEKHRQQSDNMGGRLAVEFPFPPSIFAHLAFYLSFFFWLLSFASLFDFLFPQVISIEQCKRKSTTSAGSARTGSGTSAECWEN